MLIADIEALEFDFILSKTYLKTALESAIEAAV
jgi:hypothetical protein